MESKIFSEGPISSLQNLSLKVDTLDPQGRSGVPLRLFEKISNQHGLFFSLLPAGDTQRGQGTKTWSTAPLNHGDPDRKRGHPGPFSVGASALVGLPVRPRVRPESNFLTFKQLQKPLQGNGISEKCGITRSLLCPRTITAGKDREFENTAAGGHTL